MAIDSFYALSELKIVQFRISVISYKNWYKYITFGELFFEILFLVQWISLEKKKIVIRKF